MNMKFSVLYLLCLCLVVVVIVPYCVAFNTLDTVEMFFSSFIANYKRIINIDHSQPIENVVRFYCTHATTKIRAEVRLNDIGVTQKVDFSKPINILIHGWKDSTANNWMNNTAYDWSLNTNTNVFEVDWSKIAFDGYVKCAIVNIRVAAYYILPFIDFLIINGLDISTTQIAGHSLGSHIAGFIGQNYGGRLNMIYGLDPAGPLFTFPILNPRDLRLDTTDAQFVQVIHTCSYILGAGRKIGHQDFFPNSGKYPQPGCQWPFIGDYISSPDNSIKCSHYKSIEYFRSSTSPSMQCSYLNCGSLIRYVTRTCNRIRDVIGPFTKRIAGVYYAKTTGFRPYCTGRDYF